MTLACKTPLFRDRRRGPSSPFGPWLADAMMVDEGHAPVVAVLLASVKKADESIAAPRRARTPDPAASAFPLQTGRSQGPPEGATIAILDPLASRPAVMVGEGHTPVVPVLLSCVAVGSVGLRLRPPAWVALWSGAALVGPPLESQPATGMRSLPQRWPRRAAARPPQRRPSTARSAPVSRSGRPCRARKSRN